MRTSAQSSSGSRRAGLLSPGLDVDRAADVLWTINHPNTWQLLVVQRGWTPEQYEQWSGDAACRELLGR